MSLNLTLGQTLTAAPSLIGMMQIMQMNSLELTAYLQELSLENPLVEVAEPTEARASAQQRRWLESLDTQNRAFEQSDRQSQGIPDPNPETLEAYLLRQVAALNLSQRIGKTVEYLIALLDENGWLEESPQELCRLTGQPEAVVDAALAQLQSMEPAGVGAANLEDCLLLQLDQEENTSPLTRAIVREHLADVAAGRYEKIAKAQHAPVAEVRAACNRIRITADGKIKPCLHSGREIDVRGKHGRELVDTLRNAILCKPKMHGTLDAEHLSEAGRTMNTIGG